MRCYSSEINYLTIKDANRTYCGGDQIWYGSSWRKQAGCGPTNAALLCKYLSQTHPEYKALAPKNLDLREEFSAFMDCIWDYVTPKAVGGVHRADIFLEGLLKYAESLGIDLPAKALHVPASKRKRPHWEEVSAFISESLKNKAIVPFLNNSRGKEKRLYTWHWVSVIELEPSTGKAIVADEGRKKEVNLRLWLETTGLGGGFVGVF